MTATLQLPNPREALEDDAARLAAAQAALAGDKTEMMRTA